MPATSSDISEGGRKYDASGRQRDAERRRQRVVEAATQLFLERGYGATSIDDIAHAADVATPTIYATFGSKAGVLKRAVDVAVGGDHDDIAMFDRVEFRSVTAESPIEDRLRFGAAIAYEIHSRSAPLLRLVASVAGADPAVAELHADLGRQLRETMVAYLASLPPDTRRTDLDEDELVEMIDLVAGPATWSQLVTDAGWSRERYEWWSAEAMRQLVLAPPAPS